VNSERKFTYIRTNGVRLHAVLAGPKTGKPVILLHGFPEFWRGWEKQIGPLARAGLRAIVPDQRGYNLSDKPKSLAAYRLDVIARDVVGLIDALGYDRAALVGHDWGGAAAWATAVLFPERIGQLAILNAPYPPVVFRTLPRHPAQLLRSAYIYFFQLPRLPEAVLRNQDWELLAQGMQRTSRPGTFSAADFDAYRQAWWRKGAMTGMLNWYRALFRCPILLPLNPRLAMPALLLWGARDVALGRELAEASLALCARGELVFFEDATHWLQHEEAIQVNELLINFLIG
jgi:pimeloyl-ACP methyl ester carboxylesterase